MVIFHDTHKTFLELLSNWIVQYWRRHGCNAANTKPGGRSASLVDVNGIYRSDYHAEMTPGLLLLIPPLLGIRIVVFWDDILQWVYPSVLCYSSSLRGFF